MNRRQTLRDEAIARGELVYLPEKPCKNGHTSPRKVYGYQCVACKDEWVKNNKNKLNEYVATYIAKDPTGPARRTRQWRERNPERVKELDKKWRLNNPEKAREKDKRRYHNDPEGNKKRTAKYRTSNREKILARAREIYAENPQKFRIKNQLRRAKNPRKHAIQHKEWKERNPDRIRHLWRMDAARRRGADGQHTEHDINNLLRGQRKRCVYCHTKLDKFHVDHIVPVSKGGSNDRKNLQLLCPPCNHKKHAKDPIDFAQSLGFLL